MNKYIYNNIQNLFDGNFQKLNSGKVASSQLNNIIFLLPCSFEKESAQKVLSYKLQYM